MPLPQPDKESEKEYVSRCMGDDKMNSEFPNQPQRFAVCKSMWKRAKAKKKENGSVDSPNWSETEREINDLGAIVTF